MINAEMIPPQGAPLRPNRQVTDALLLGKQQEIAPRASLRCHPTIEGTPDMRKFSWILIALLTIGFASGFASASFAGPHNDQGQQDDSQGNNNNQGD